MKVEGVEQCHKQPALRRSSRIAVKREDEVDQAAMEVDKEEMQQRGRFVEVKKIRDEYRLHGRLGHEQTLGLIMLYY